MLQINIRKRIRKSKIYIYRKGKAEVKKDRVSKETETEVAYTFATGAVTGFPIGKSRSSVWFNPIPSVTESVSTL